MAETASLPDGQVGAFCRHSDWSPAGGLVWRYASQTPTQLSVSTRHNRRASARGQSDGVIEHNGYINVGHIWTTDRNVCTFVGDTSPRDGSGEYCPAANPLRVEAPHLRRLLQDNRAPIFLHVRCMYHIITHIRRKIFLSVDRPNPSIARYLDDCQPLRHVECALH